jgi:uncharacterized protein (DUF2147 family)
MSLRAGLLGAALLAAEAAAQTAREPTGIWHTEGQQAQVRIARCPEGLCGTIVALKNPLDPATGEPQLDSENEDVSKRERPVLGLQVVLGLKPAGASTWAGRFYSPEEGKTVSGDLTLKDANTLTVRGCLLGGLLCRSETWTRAK